jgi:DNA/RNA endonuclease YhcR with UshA esterase domain
MRRSFLWLSIVLLTTSSIFGQFNIVRKWVRAAKFSGADSLPTWFSPSGNTERGMGVFLDNDTPFVAVLSRFGGNFIRVLNGINGSDYLTIPLLPSEVSHGTLVICDGGFTEDGEFFFSNLKGSQSDTFKVYTLYFNQSDNSFHSKVLLKVLSGTNVRLGDKITVTGKWADKTAKIIAMSATSGAAKVYIWSQDTDSSFNPTPTEISLSDNATGASPSVSFLPNGDFIVNYNGSAPKKYTASGQLIGSVSSGIIPTGSNAIRYVATDDVGNEYYATFAYGLGREHLVLFRLLGGNPNSAELIGETESLRQNTNGNGTGDVEFYFEPNKGPRLFVLSTNNGLGAYNVSAYGSYDVSVKPYLTKAILSWKLSGGDFKISYHDGKPYNAFYYQNNRAYGVIVDLAKYQNAKLKSLDFAYYGWETEHGPYYYNLYVVDINDSTVLYKADNLFVEDAYYTIKWATNVSLNNVGAQSKIGIFIQPLSGADAANDAYPSIMTDSTTPPKINGQVHVWNPQIVGNKFKFTNLYNPRNLNLGNFVMDVYVSIPVEGQNKIVKAPIAEEPILGIQSNVDEKVKKLSNLKFVAKPARYIPGFLPMVNLLGFNIYRGASPTSLSLYQTVSGATLEFVDENPLVDSNYYYGVSAVYAGNKESIIKVVAHYQPKFMTIAEAVKDTNGDFRPDLLGKKVIVKGIVTSPNFQGNTTRTDIVIQDGNKGITIYKSNQKIDLSLGTEVAVMGVIDQYRGKTEIVPNNVFEDIIILSLQDVPEPIELTNLSQVGEQYENVLVKVKNLQFVQPVTWPQVGQSGNVTVTDGTNQMTMRIWAGTELPGWTEVPMDMRFNLTFIVDQFTSSSSVYTGGYQIKPRFKEDFKPAREVSTLKFKWARMAKNNTLPKYWTMAGSNYERGFAVGKVNDKFRLYVVSRSGGPKLVVHDALTGDSLTTILPTSTITGGLFPMNDAGVSQDGIIFVNNMTLNADATNPFKVYRYDSETSAPIAVVSLNLNNVSQRMGDMVNYVGKTTDNSFQIWAGINAGSGPAKVVKFTTNDSGKTFSHQVITINGPTSGSNANAFPVNDTTFIYKRYGEKLYYCHINGSVIDTISTALIGTGASRIRYFEVDDDNGKLKIVAAYYASANGAEGFERVDFVDVTNGFANAELIAKTPSIGNKTNGNASGDIDILVNNNMFYIYVLGANNGIAAFNTNDEYLTSPDTLTYANAPGVLYTVTGNGGFVFGTNKYGDLGKYQRLDFQKNDILYGGVVYFGYKKIINASDFIDLVVKTVNKTTGAPDSLLFKTTIKTSNIDTTAAGTQFWLDTPFVLDGPVFIGVEWAATVDDTFGIKSDIHGKGDNAKRAWEKWDDGSYKDVKTAWGIDADIWIAGLYKKAYYPVVSVEDLAGVIPSAYSLEQNYPNPFNPTTTIQFSLRTDAKVTLSIYNILGQKIATLVDQEMNAGVKKVTFDATRLASGVYMYKLEVKGTDGSKFVDTKKMMLLK